MSMFTVVVVYAVGVPVVWVLMALFSKKAGLNREDGRLAWFWPAIPVMLVCYPIMLLWCKVSARLSRVWNWLAAKGGR